MMHEFYGNSPAFAESNLYHVDFDKLICLVETQISEAEARGEARMKEKISQHSCKAWLGKCEICKHIDSIQSL